MAVPPSESEGYDSAMRRSLLIAISAAGGLAGVTGLLFAISNSGPTRQEKAYLSIRNEQSRIVIDVPTPDMTSRPARIESSFDIENAGDIAVSDVKASLTYNSARVGAWRTTRTRLKSATCHRRRPGTSGSGPR